MAFNELDLLESSLLSIRESNELIHIIISSVIVTKNNFINAKTELTNIKLQNVCKTHGWVYLNKGDIFLYDTVHLNENGENHSEARNLPISFTGCQSMNDGDSVNCKMCGVKLDSQTSASSSNIMDNDTLKAIKSRMAYLDA
ncbi:hypothetical protein MAR_012075 [Mya arenaria]|uniref:Uncharacterized protein n=1 Tax=Mya arenaria TaxID=6604 RepID=A0ABY7FZY3_MYAAR|nr:hypothetical protein MAR_012075 [Mya arenaria]